MAALLSRSLVKFSTWKSQLPEQFGGGGKLARARRWLRSAGKDSSAEDASALGSGSGGALSAERGLRGTGQLVSPRRASGMARTTGRRRIGRLVRPTAGRRNRERQWRVSTGSRFTAEQAGVDFDRAMGARSTLANLVFVRVRRNKPQLAAAAPTAPRLEAGGIFAERRR